MTTKQKFYVVWKGRKTGIYNTWEECAAQVSGYTGAEYKAFPTLKMANAAFKGNYEDYKGKASPAFSQELLLEIAGPITPSYTVDAACNGSPGELEYRGVDVGSGKQIFHQGPFPEGTNNIGEFLAIAHALSLCKKKGLNIPIYTDSETALAWVRAKKCRTNLLRSEKNSDLFDLIARAETWLADNDYGNPLLKWDTNAWGENPADFRRK